MVSNTHRQRERERGREQEEREHPSSQPRSDQPRSCQPHRPDHTPAKLFFFCLLFLNASSLSYSTTSTTNSLLTDITHLKISAHPSLITDPQTPKTHLSNALVDLATTTDRRSSRHRSPDHSTPPPNPPDLAATASIHSNPFFPSISHSFFLLSPSLLIKDVFILIFGCVKCIF